MTKKELETILKNMDAEDNLPVNIRVDFGDGKKSYTHAEVTKFHQFSDVLLLRTRIDFEIDKLMEFREWLVSETERFQENAKAPNASSEGAHYDRGHAAAFISARDKLEELFNYWDCR
jgi:hypothetical protein